MVLLRSMLAMLAAPVVVFAKTRLLMSSCNHAAGKDPVSITASEAHRVLSDFLHVAADALPMRAHSDAPSHGLWHHLPKDAADYDADALLHPTVPQGSVMVLVHGAEEDVLPATLTPTYQIPAHKSPSRHSFDALAELYHSKMTGDAAPWTSAPSAHGALERLEAELNHVADLANGTPADWAALGSARIEALSDIEREFGRDSAVYRHAKAQVKHALQTLSERIEAVAGASLALVHTAADGTHERRAAAPLMQYELLQPFVAEALPEAAGAPSSTPMASCPSSKQALESMTDSCHGRGTPIETRKGGRMCWRCQCRPTREKGKTTYWTGAACEKQDVSAQTLMILGTVAVLFVSVVGSIALLYREGSHDLPGTLSSVSLRPM